MLLVKKACNLIVNSDALCYKHHSRHAVVAPGNIRQEIQKRQFGDFLQNRCFYKFRNIRGKTTELESLFNEV